MGRRAIDTPSRDRFPRADQRARLRLKKATLSRRLLRASACGTSPVGPASPFACALRTQWPAKKSCPAAERAEALFPRNAKGGTCPPFKEVNLTPFAADSDPCFRFLR